MAEQIDYDALFHLDNVNSEIYGDLTRNLSVQAITQEGSHDEYVDDIPPADFPG